MDSSARSFLGHSSESNKPQIIRDVEVLLRAIGAINYPVEKPKRGRKPQSNIKNLIYRISQIFDGYGKTQKSIEDFYFNAINEKYEGQLVEILTHVFDNFAPELKMSNNAIGEQIRRTIGNRSGG